MQVCYLLIDRHGRLRKAPRALIEAAWKGEGSWEYRRPGERYGDGRFIREDLMRLTGGGALRLMTVILDRRLRPLDMYFLRVPLGNSYDVPLSAWQHGLKAQAGMAGYIGPRALRWTCRGWPRDLWKQLAVALDVPLDALSRCHYAFGGPLSWAAALDLTLEEAYYDERQRLRQEGKDV